MPEHKFREGQAVEDLASRWLDRVGGDRYTIVRLLPDEGNHPQYRIKSIADGRERMVWESEIIASSRPG